jgi:hypothetical protein
MGLPEVFSLDGKIALVTGAGSGLKQLPKRAVMSSAPMST